MSLLAGIPSVVYGLVGMMVLVPAIRILFHVPDGASLLASIIVLAVMILPSIINVSLTALESVPKEYKMHLSPSVQRPSKPIFVFLFRLQKAALLLPLYWVWDVRSAKQWQS